MRQIDSIRKSKLTFVLFALSCYFSFGQTATVVWDKVYGIEDWNDLREMIPTQDGNFLLGGTVYTTEGNFTRNAFDYYVVKVDTEGTILWEKTIGGNKEDSLGTLLNTDDGGYLVFGSSNSEISRDRTVPLKNTTSQPNNNGSDIWIVKLDSDGNQLWDTAIHEKNNLISNTFISTDDGGFLAGRFFTGRRDFLVIRYNIDGTKQWERSFGNDGLDDRLIKIERLQDGNYLLLGYTVNGIAEYSSGDYFIVKIDPAGNELWKRTLGSLSVDTAWRAVSTENGGALVGGTTFGPASGDRTEKSRGNFDIWLTSFDTNGTLLWEKTLGGNGVDTMGDILILEDGNFLIAGSSSSDQGFDKSDPPYDTRTGRGRKQDVWLVKVNSAGTKLWDKTIGGTLGDVSITILALNDGSFLVGGSSESPISGDKTVANTGERNFWLLKIQETGIGYFVDSFTLIDAKQNTDIKTIKEEEPTFVSFKTDGLQDINFRANIVSEPNEVKSVTFSLSGTVNSERTENVVPYALFGDRDGNYTLTDLPKGTYTLTATPYNEPNGNGTAGSSHTINFSIVDNPSITKAILVDGINDTDLLEITDGSVLEGDAVAGLLNKNIRVETNSDEIGSVRLELSGPILKVSKENKAPYAVFYDFNGNYTENDIPVGEYTLKATPYSKIEGTGIAGEAKTISFSVIPKKDVITSFTLVDATTNTDILELSDQLEIDRVLLPNGPLSIRASVLPSVQVGSVSLELSGELNHMENENVVPYTLFGNNNEDYEGAEFPLGSYEVEATPYSGKRGTGVAGNPLKLSFRIISNATSKTGKTMKIYPNAATTEVIVEVLNAQVSIASISVHTMSGMEVRSYSPSATTTTYTMPLDNLPRGLYFIKIKDKDGHISTERLVVGN